MHLPMSSAYNLVPLTETLKLVNFVIGNILYQFKRGSYGHVYVVTYFITLLNKTRY